MKRDMELIRLLLLEVEEGKPPAGWEKYSSEQKLYHKALLIEKGLVKGKPHTREGKIDRVDLKELTWEGHDFLEGARNGTIWNKTMTFVREKGGEVTLELLKELLKKFAREQFGL